MAFKIRTAKDRLNKPDGIYIPLNGREWLVNEINLSASGNVCLKIFDPVSYESQVLTLCSLNELIQKYE
jgi:hypothetical protein